MSFFKQTIKDVPLDRKTVLVRADYNVPLTKKGEISDDLRIRASLPTLQYLVDEGCKVIVVSHLGRPKGVDPSLSLEPVADRLAKLLKKDVSFVQATSGDRVRQVVKRLSPGSILMLENLRFHPEEESNDKDFAKSIVKSVGADYFVQDGFGVVHRAHASTSAIALFIPGVSGLLLEREYEAITSAVRNPKRPLVAVLGGAKVSDKIGVIERFVEVADTIIIGGAMANTFLDYKGVSTGGSKVERDQRETLDRIYNAAQRKLSSNRRVDDFIVLPVDVAVAGEISEKESRLVRSVNDVKSSDIVLDIGDATIDRMSSIVKEAGTVVWNGTLGYAELPEFAHGSARLALELAKHPDIISVIGGGDTADFALKWDGNGGKSFTHVSTGGGASLELMSGNKLPGIEVLLDARR